MPVWDRWRHETHHEWLVLWSAAGVLCMSLGETDYMQWHVHLCVLWLHGKVVYQRYSWAAYLIFGIVHIYEHYKPHSWLDVFIITVCKKWSATWRWIWRSQIGGHEEFCLLRYDTV
jgi:hypothetical protein